MAKSINRRADFGLLVFAVGMLLLTGCGGGSSSSSSKGGTTSSTPTTTSADFVKVSVNGAPEVTYTELKTSDIYASIISNGYTIAACVPSCSTGLDFGIYFTGLTGPGTATLGTVATFYVSFMD
ncbi:MAG: hypothetical protein OEW39_11310, partial [Deltaproteobacteria bacterium]|nr:hypothetical protein [Deltaproteobacteria bacterium]